MTAEEALEELGRMIVRTRDVDVLVVGRPVDNFVAERLRLSDDLSTDFKAIAQRSFLEVSDEEVTLIPFDPGRKLEPNEVFFLDITEHPDIGETIQMLGSTQQAALFDEDEEFIESLRFYCIVQGTANDRAVFIRQYSRSKELSRKPGIAAVFGGGVYDKLEDKVFLFDSRIDCFHWHNFLFIKHPAAFETIFDLMAEVRQKADETLDAILARIPVLNGAEFRASCKGQIQMLSKLFQIARKPYFGTVTLDGLRQTIKAFNLDVEIRDIDGNSQLVFDSHPKKRWLILKLLDDNFLESEMTDTKYEANSKSPLTTR